MREFENQAKLLRHYRIKHKMSQGELGDAIGVHKQLVSNMERGIQGITKFKVHEIIKTLKIPKAKIKRAYIADSKAFIENLI